MQFAGREGRKLVPLVVGSYLTHKPSNVANMQIVKSNSNRRSRTSISRQLNIYLYNKCQSTMKSNINMLLEKLNETRTNYFRLSIMKKTNTLLDEMIHITLACVVHPHGHWNKVMPFMKPFRLADLNNGIKFHNRTCWSTNDIRNYCFLCWVNNHHIVNKDLVFLNHVKISW
jgi:hypothetical protein